MATIDFIHFPAFLFCASEIVQADIHRALVLKWKQWKFYVRCDAITLKLFPFILLLDRGQLRQCHSTCVYCFMRKFLLKFELQFDQTKLNMHEISFFRIIWKWLFLYRIDLKNRIRIILWWPWFIDWVGLFRARGCNRNKRTYRLDAKKKNEFHFWMMTIDWFTKMSVVRRIYVKAKWWCRKQCKSLPNIQFISWSINSVRDALRTIYHRYYYY